MLGFNSKIKWGSAFLVFTSIFLLFQNCGQGVQSKRAERLSQLGNNNNGSIPLNEQVVVDPQAPLSVYAMDSDTLQNDALSVTFQLNKVDNEAVTIYYETLDGTAVAAQHYTATQGRVTIPAGQESTTISIAALGAGGVDLAFSLKITAVSKGTVAKDSALVVIRANLLPYAFKKTTTEINNNGAPAARFSAHVYWTGTYMLVWGGWADNPAVTALSNGALYDPATNTWTPINTNGAPSARRLDSSLWTGTKMIVWGGAPGSGIAGNPVNGGAIFDPATNTWAPMSTTNAPSPRTGHSAVWTGTKMIIYGGYNNTTRISYNDGGIYDPATDTWEALPANTTAPDGNGAHGVAWKNNKMYVWGGWRYRNLAFIYTSYGAIYDYANKTWTAMNANGAPQNQNSAQRKTYQIDDKIIFVGVEGIPLGSIYDMTNDSWVDISTQGAPNTNEEVVDESAFVVGKYLYILSKNNGWKLHRLDPVLNTWTFVSDINMPNEHFTPYSAWSGTQLILWGGTNQATPHNRGYIFQ